MFDFEAAEELDGVRLSWNCFPTTHLDSTTLATPISCFYSPLKDVENMPIIDDNPIMGKQQNSTILNPFSQVDVRSGTWTCPITLQRNPVPQNLMADPQKLDSILRHSTIEYNLPKSAKYPPIYLILIDTATDPEELDSIKNSILSSLNIIPENSLLALITFGRNVNIYELEENASNAIKCHSFNGNKLYGTSELRNKLGILFNKSTRDFVGTKYFQPLMSCEFQLQLILDNIVTDSFRYNAMKQRSLRCTGNALSLTLALLESCFPKTGVEILAFISGPCNYGKYGKVTSSDLKDYLRSHKDIRKRNKIYHEDSKNFYEEMSNRAARHGYVTNFFIGSFDQVGLFEMVSMSDSSGGSIVFADSFKTSIFKNSFIKFLQDSDQKNDEDSEEEGENANTTANSSAPRPASCGLNGSLEVRTSNHLKISGMIGHGISINNATTNNISDKKTGHGGTNSWKLNKISSDSTYCIYFDVNHSVAQQQYSDNASCFIQFIFYYQHPDGNFRLRVTTISRPIRQMSRNFELFVQSFDQEAAIVALARQVSFRIFNQLEDVEKVIADTDETLVKLMKKFSQSNGMKLEMHSNFSMFPQFVYNLRRSFILRLFNYSPDESSYYNHILCHEDVNNCLIIIQPVLISYEQDPNDASHTIVEPVLLDSTSIKPTRILLLDTFFEVLIFYGSTIAEWKKMGYQDDPEYADFAQFLQLPRAEITNILVDRNPLPRFIDCDEGGSQARFLYSKLNPSNTYSNNNVYGGGGAILLTDDVSLQKYVETITSKVLEV